MASPDVTVTDDLAEVAAERIAAALAGGGSLALSGGSTPRATYARLATMPLPWDKIDVFFADERCVPPDHHDSNWRMVDEALLSHVPVRAHRMPGEAVDRTRAAAEYAALLPDALDVLVLGMGDDLHTASLFPGDGALDETRKVAVVAQASMPPRIPRFTITPPVIQAAKRIFVLVAGRAKSAALGLALGGRPDPRRRPIQLAQRGTWIVDHDAAIHLAGSKP